MSYVHNWCAYWSCSRCAKWVLLLMCRSINRLHKYAWRSVLVSNTRWYCQHFLWVLQWYWNYCFIFYLYSLHIHSLYLCWCSQLTLSHSLVPCFYYSLVNTQEKCSAIFFVARNFRFNVFKFNITLLFFT
jgi:hypothetical protein